jgi:hypothetical protein
MRSRTRAFPHFSQRVARPQRALHRRSFATGDYDSFMDSHLAFYMGTTRGPLAG